MDCEVCDGAGLLCLSCGGSVDLDEAQVGDPCDECGAEIIECSECDGTGEAIDEEDDDAGDLDDDGDTDEE